MILYILYTVHTIVTNYTVYKSVQHSSLNMKRNAIFQEIELHSTFIWWVWDKVWKQQLLKPKCQNCDVAEDGAQLQQGALSSGTLQPNLTVGHVHHQVQVLQIGGSFQSG